MTPAPRLLPPFAPTPRAVLLGLVALGAASFALGLAWLPGRTWPALLVSAVLLASAALGGLVFVALHYATNARWSVGIRRVPEAMVGALPAAGVAVLLVAAGAAWVYPWADPARVHGDEILEGRAGWMNVPLFALRTAAFFAVWTVLGLALVRRSRRQDADGDPAHRARNARTSALFLVVFGLTFSVAVVDWLVSAEAHWSSTIFAIYQFSGVFLSGLAAITLLVLWLRRRGDVAPDDGVLHDLGKLLFGFSLFWGYIWFSQYLLIWYVNNPEETPWYLVRHAGIWQVLSVLTVLLNWTVPFVLLMPRAAKRSAGVLAGASVAILLGRWLDLVLVVLPATGADPSGFYPWDALLPVAAAAAFLLLWRRAMTKASVVPLREAIGSHAHGS